MSTVLAGHKRKRYTPVETDVSVKLTGKLHHGLRQVRKTTKKVKAFETQRLVKKLKQLRKPIHNPETFSDDIKDLEAQLESLKSIDHERIAHLTLSSKIRKDKTLSSNKALVAALAPLATSATHRKPKDWHPKAESRFLSSKSLAVEVGSVINGLRAVLEPELKTRTARNLGLLPIDDVAEERQKNGKSDDRLESVAKQWVDDGRAAEDEGADKRVGLGDNVVDETDDMADDGSWESGFIDEQVQADSDASDSTVSARHAKRVKQRPSAGPNLGSPEQCHSAAASTFLPSLAVGFIKGRSLSDFEESEGEIAETERKNRRGQRARQAIWEKKYGKNAKHVKKQQEASATAARSRALGKRPDSRWTGQKGHSISISNRGQGRDAEGKTSSQTTNPSRGGTEGNHRVEKPSHPSWEAKKKLKEREGAQILPPQGRKIVFV